MIAESLDQISNTLVLIRFNVELHKANRSFGDNSNLCDFGLSWIMFVSSTHLQFAN